MCKEPNPIREQKDREENVYWIYNRGQEPLEDDYSEESNADSTCRDNTASASWS